MFVLLPYTVNLLHKEITEYAAYTYEISYRYIFLYGILIFLSVFISFYFLISKKSENKYIKIVTLPILLLETILFYNFGFITGSLLACFFAVLTLMNILFYNIGYTQKK